VANLRSRSRENTKRFERLVARAKSCSKRERKNRLLVRRATSEARIFPGSICTAFQSTSYSFSALTGAPSSSNVPGSLRSKKYVRKRPLDGVGRS
jgi:hypothetical protein